MAEVDELPHMAGCMRRGPEVVHRQLRDYSTKLVRQQGLSVTADEIHVACIMLQGVLFSDAMGRDLMPDMYPPLKRAGAGYAGAFLKMLGARNEPVSGDANGPEGTRSNNGGRAVTVTKRRNGQGKPARPPRGT